MQAGVFARFRIELPSRDDLGQDWVVAMPIEAAWNDWSGRIGRVYDDRTAGGTWPYAAYSSAIASASSRIETPSSSSSGVIVSGGHTITTFQCTIR